MSQLADGNHAVYSTCHAERGVGMDRVPKICNPDLKYAGVGGRNTGATRRGCASGILHTNAPPSG